MASRRLSALLVITVLLHCIPPAGADEDLLEGFDAEEVVADEWLECRIQGRTLGYHHQVTLRGIWNGAHAYALQRRSWLRLAREDEITESESSSVLIADAELHPLLYRTHESTDGFESHTERHYQAHTMRRTSTEGGATSTKEFTVDRAALSTPSLHLTVWYRDRPTGPVPEGTTLEGRTYDTGTEALETYAYRYDGERTLDDGTVVHLWTHTAEDMAEVEERHTVTPAGKILRVEQPMANLVRSSETAYRAWSKEAAASLTTKIRTGIHVPGKLADGIEWMRLRLTPKDGEYRELVLPPTACQEARRDGDEWVVTLRAVPAPEDPEPPASDPPPDLARYLRASSHIQCDDPEIRGTAAEIVGDADSALEKTRRILAWLKENIEPTDEIVGGPSAKDVLRMRRGDCSESSVLFMALARSVGIPTRGQEGLLFEGEAFEFHGWNQVYVGTWVPVDATRERLGIPGTYLTVSREGCDRMVDLNLLLSLVGRYDLRLEAVRTHGLEFEGGEAAAFRPESSGSNPFEIVELTDGIRLTGRVEAANEEGLSLQSTLGRVEIPRNRLASVRYLDVPAGTRYENPELGVVWVAPDGWGRRVESQLIPGSLVEFQHETKIALCVMLTERFEGGLDLYATLLRRALKQRMPNLVDLGVKKETMLGVESRRWSYRLVPQGKEYRYVTRFLRRGDLIVRIVAWMPEEEYTTYAPVVDELLRGLRSSESGSEAESR